MYVYMYKQKPKAKVGPTRVKGSWGEGSPVFMLFSAFLFLKLPEGGVPRLHAKTIYI